MRFLLANILKKTANILPNNVEKNAILIVEIKSNNPNVKEIFNNEIPYQRSRYSKYCIGINLLYNKNHFQRLIK